MAVDQSNKRIVKSLGNILTVHSLSGDAANGLFTKLSSDKMSSLLVNGSSNSTDGLPKQFVTSLRILFDILDEDRSGYVRLRDIESRWHEEGVTGLPSGVIETLRKVAPRNGRLTFDNFVTGLKLSLLKRNGSNSNQDFNPRKRRELSQQERSRSGNTSKQALVSDTATKYSVRQLNQSPDYVNIPNERQDYVNIGPSEGRDPPNEVKDYVNIGHKDRVVSNSNQNTYHASHRTRPKMGSRFITSSGNNNTAAIRPNNLLQSQNIELRNQIYTRDQKQQASTKAQGKTDQAYTHVDRIHSARPPDYHQRHSYDGNQIRKEMQKDIHSRRPTSAHTDSQRTWDSNFNQRSNDIPVCRPDRPPPYQRTHDRDQDVPPSLPPKNMNGRIMNELKNWQKDHEIGQPSQKGHLRTVNSDPQLVNHNRLTGNEIYVNIDQIRKHEASQQSTSGVKKPVRRQNSRRHTLSSGIDYNVIRRMKQLEQEKDVLLQGLEVVDRARDWYLKQITSVADKQNYAEKTSCSDVTLQTQQERMDFVRSRITDVNMNLKTLMETSESGFPAHMNLAIRSSVFQEDMSTKWLKDQNKQLTQEVGSKSDRITKLEKEKASLIRDLFEARTQHKTSYDDTTFM